MKRDDKNEEFASALIGKFPLDDAIDWIRHNLKPDDVFTEPQLKKWSDENHPESDES